MYLKQYTQQFILSICLLQMCCSTAVVIFSFVELEQRWLKYSLVLYFRMFLYLEGKQVPTWQMGTCTAGSPHKHVIYSRSRGLYF